MGTDLQNTLNPLGPLQKGNGDALNIVGVPADSWAYLKKRFLRENLTSFNWLQESMDRLLEQYNRDSLREMMLKQEGIFKEQVQELHRLYRIQKMLMPELRGNREQTHASLASTAPGATHIGSDYVKLDTQTQYWITGTSSRTSHCPYSNIHHLPTQPNSEHNFYQSFYVRSEQNSNEVSNNSGYGFRMQRGFNLEHPDEDDNFSEFNLMRDRTSIFREASKDKMANYGPQDLHFCSDKGGDIELTLSIGHTTDKKKQKHPCLNLKLGCFESPPNETRQLMTSMSVRSDQEECNDATAASFNQGSIHIGFLKL